MKYRSHLPQLDGGMFVTDGGLETTLIFHDGIELPEFAAFDLLKDEQGAGKLREYFATYARLAREHNAGFVAEAPTWRANLHWGEKIGYSAEQLEKVNRKSIELMEGLRSEFESESTPIVISGCIGPEDDGYNPGELLSANAAQRYHSAQVEVLSDTAADMVTATTMTYVEEAIGIVRAAVAADIPVAVAFTVETDGLLPSGQALGDAINQVNADTDGAPAYFMINCAHPTHFDRVLAQGDGWQDQVRGLLANASTKSHAELDEATELDPGDPSDLAARYAALSHVLPNLTILGGCCGTDHRHVSEICAAWPAAATAA